MKVAFLDRDGVINKDTGYLYKVDEFEFIPGCVAALKQLADKGYRLMIVTNQSGIGRGYYTEQDYQALTTWYRGELLVQGVPIQGVYHCPHSPESECDCRKPKAGLFRQALRQHPEINFSQSLMVGDKLSDLTAASRIGIHRLILVGNKKGAYDTSPESGVELERFHSLASFVQSL